MRPTLSIVIPTLGRPTLQRTLDSIDPQILPEDQVYLVADGYEAGYRAQEQLQKTGCWENGRVIVCPTVKAMAGNPGGTQRNAALDARPAGDYLLWCGDDDIYLPGALEAVRTAAETFPGQPLMFRMQAWFGTTLWREDLKGVLIQGNVGDHMFIAPNIPGKLGRFGPTYSGDFDFIQQTVALQGGPDRLVWRPEVIVQCRPKEESNPK